jgi:hypothetical protein
MNRGDTRALVSMRQPLDRMTAKYTSGSLKRIDLLAEPDTGAASGGTGQARRGEHPADM